MIITRAPYRVSFFGGGTDYHTHYEEHGGKVLSVAIDKYCYIQLRKIKPFFDFKYRLSWKEIEEKSQIDDINHPVVREVFRMYNMDFMSLHHEGDLPGRSGIGSSSSFTTCMLKAASMMQDIDLTKKEIAQLAIKVEREILKENVGVQDQIAAAFGGFNKITIDTTGDFDVSRINLDDDISTGLNSHLMLFFTGLQRISSDVAGEQIKTAKQKATELKQMAQMVDEGESILASSNIVYDDFGKLLHESWMLKRSLTSKVSNNTIDEIYSTALQNGAIGGKILGAGSGGFMLFFARPEHHNKIRAALSDLLYIPFGFDKHGTEVVFHT